MQINEIVQSRGGLVRRRTGEQVSINLTEQRPRAKVVTLASLGVGQTFQVGGRIFKKLEATDAHNLTMVLRLGPGRPSRPVMPGDMMVEV